jgi:formylglycine-generating enzyme required for sulfatase activity
MVWIKPGTFSMGSPQGEKNRISDELQHSVTLTKGFYIGKTEVTQAQWQAVMGDNPSLFKGANLPVEKVKWDDAVAFCSELTKRARKAGRLPEGYAYRLPTEAEWEYACRAGTTGPYAIRQGWYKKNSGDKTHEVGKKKTNAWDLHDMHGNVAEWCQDWYDAYPVEHVRDPRGPANGSEHVLRGGNYGNQARTCRSANRHKMKPLGHGSYFGFRAVLAPQSRERQ